jgi:hypothetical protein
MYPAYSVQALSPPQRATDPSFKNTQKNQSKKAAAIFNTPVCSQTKIGVQWPHDVPVLHTDTNSSPGTAETTEKKLIVITTSNYPELPNRFETLL